MFIIFALSFFILGTIIGSFLNVVILRYNTGKSVAGRSSCASCRKPLGAHELVPVVSFILLGGKCSNCKSRISYQYPLVEFFTGILLLLIFIKLFFSGNFFPSDLLNYSLQSFIPYILTVAYLIVQACLLVVIFVYDLKHKIIPNGPVYAFALLALVRMVLYYAQTFPHFDTIFILNMLAGPFFFLIFFLIWLLSRGRAMGFGDAKLVLGIGWFLGLTQGLSALILSFWIGAVVSISLILTQYVSKKITAKPGRKKRSEKHSDTGSELNMHSQVPFAPFLIIGLIIAYAYQLDILSLHVIFNI